MSDNLLSLVVALSINEFVHNIFELWGINQKIDWLGKTMSGKHHGSWPIHIDTKLKTVVLHAALLLVVSGLAYWLISYLSLSAGTKIWLTIILLVVNYVYVVWRTDIIHARIGRLSRKSDKS
jgi:hypothetical protein